MEPLASSCCCCWCRVRILNVHRDLPVGPPRSILDKAAGFSQQPSTMGWFAAWGCSDFLRCWGELESISIYHALEGAKVLGNWVHLGRVCLTLKPQEREAVSIFLKFCSWTGHEDLCWNTCLHYQRDYSKTFSRSGSIPLLKVYQRQHHCDWKYIYIF